MLISLFKRAAFVGSLIANAGSRILHCAWGEFSLCARHQRGITGDTSLDTPPLKVVEELISIDESISFAVPPP